MNINLDKNAIQKQRLLKKIEKLKQQRDNFKKQYEFLHNIIKRYPQYMSDFRSYERSQIERQRIKNMEERVKEQALLIKKLASAEVQK